MAPVLRPWWRPKLGLQTRIVILGGTYTCFPSRVNQEDSCAKGRGERHVCLRAPGFRGQSESEGSPSEAVAGHRYWPWNVQPYE